MNIYSIGLFSKKISVMFPRNIQEYSLKGPCILYYSMHAPRTPYDVFQGHFLRNFFPYARVCEIHMMLVFSVNKK